MTRHVSLDLGGEGRHPGVWNVNPSRTITLGTKRGELIPRLICARIDALPFAARSIHQLLVERTPLSEKGLREIARVMAPDGEVVLRHVPFPGTDRHALARRILPGMSTQSVTQIDHQTVLETRIRIAGS